MVDLLEISIGAVTLSLAAFGYLFPKYVDVRFEDGEDF